MAAVEIRNVRKSFGASEVLHGVNIDIADKEFIVLVGASGCGKSTLLRLIAGLETERHVVEYFHIRIQGIVLKYHRNIAIFRRCFGYRLSAD